MRSAGLYVLILFSKGLELIKPKFESRALKKRKGQLAFYP